MSTTRQEVNILDETITASAASSLTSSEICALDTSKYDGATYYFEIVADTSLSLTNTVTLRRKGTTTDDATCTIPLLTTLPARIRSAAFTPPAGALTEYVLFISSNAGGSTTVLAARIVVVQVSLTKTETQIEIGEAATTSTTTFTTMSLKVWKYVASSFSGTVTFAWEIVWQASSSKATATAELQQDDGAFANWTAVGSDLTTSSATVTRTRSSTFTPVDGRHYRVVVKAASSKSGFTVFNAKIIIDSSGAGMTSWRTEYFILNNDTTGSSTGAANCLQSWDSREWTAVANTYLYAHETDATGASKLVVGGVTLVTIGASGNTNQQTASVSMPDSSTCGGGFCLMDTTVNAITVDASRLIVNVVLATDTGPAFVPNTAIPLGYLPTIVYQ